MLLTARTKLLTQPLLSIGISKTLRELPQREACSKSQPLLIRRGRRSKIGLSERLEGSVGAQNIQPVTNAGGRMGIGPPLFGWSRRAKEGADHHESARQGRLQCLEWCRNNASERGTDILFWAIRYGQCSHEYVIHGESVSI